MGGSGLDPWGDSAGGSGLYKREPEVRREEIHHYHHTEVVRVRCKFCSGLNEEKALTCVHCGVAL